MSFDQLLMIFRPLLTLPEAMWLLGNTSKLGLTRHLQTGMLRAVDITAGEGERRELRIYRYSLEHLFLAPGKALERPPVELIFPHDEPMLKRLEVARLLNCTPRHVTRLQLTGRKVERAELIAFLQEREVRA
jgi:hypothetical protein